MILFVFEFDKPDRIYKAGETISCIIKISVSTKFDARSLSIRFNGIAHTEWTKSGSGSKHLKYTGDEEYFKRCQYMFGNENARDREVTSGTYMYNVVFKLPKNIPSSLEHHNGHIRYSIKANFDMSWGFNINETVFFYVSSKTDLNEFPLIREPVRDMQEKTFGCCCWKSDAMQLIIILPKSGYVPGETIPVTIEIDNNSDVRVNSVIVKLKECLTFVTNSPSIDTRSNKTTINEKCIQTPVASFQKKQFQTTIYLDSNYNFKLYAGSSIITCEYFIKLKAITSDFHSNPEVSTKIFIGTIPLTNEMTNVAFDTLSTDNLVTSSNPTAPIDSEIMEQPLPSYIDATSPGPSAGAGWNLSLRSPSGAPLASTENMLLDQDLPPPLFEDSRAVEAERYYYQ